MADRPHGSPGGVSLDDLWWEAAGPPESEEDDDEGFLTLGGQSLAALRFVAAARERLGLEIPLALLMRDNGSLRDVRAQARPAAAPAPAPAEQPRARDRSPLAPSQRRLWVVSRLHPESAAYNVVAALRLRGPVHVAALRAALRDVGRRHDALRAWVTDEPELRYDDDVRPDVAVEDSDGALTDAAVEEFVRRVGSVTIPMDRAPMLRAGLLRAADEADSCLVLSMHHIISDQATADIVLADLATAYAARSADVEPDFAPAPSFADHAEAETRSVAGTAWQADLRYWRDLLADVREGPKLPVAHSLAPSLRGARQEVVLGGERTSRVDRFLRTHGLTPAVLILGCLAVVLPRWSGTEQVVIGMPASRRRTAAEHQLVGFLIETVPLLVETGRRTDLLDVLRHVHDRHVGAITHASPTFDALLAELGLPSPPLGNPLFQVWFNDLTQSAALPRFPDVEVRAPRMPATGALFDLNFYLHRDADGFRLELVRAADRVRVGMARELLEQCMLVLDQMLTDVHVPPRAVSLVTAARRTCSPLADRPPAVTEPDSWSPTRALRGRAGDAALHTADGSVSYGALDAAVEDLHGRLCAAGVTPGQVVEVRGRRSAGLATALLAGWRAGAVVALVDAALPEARLTRQQRQLRPAAVIDVPSEALAAPELRRGVPHARTLPGASHILFTSGSGGQPAGVVVAPRPLSTSLAWYLATFRPSATDRFALVGGIGHDPVLRDLLVALHVGASISVPPDSVLTDPAALLRFLVEQQVTVLHTTPGLLELLVAAHHATPEVRLDALRLVLSGGAPLTAGLVRRLRRLTSAAVVNAYGTTETPQIAACHEVVGRDGSVEEVLSRWADDEVLPHGRGVAGGELLVLTDGDQDAGVGELGEIVVAGPLLAEGYLDDSGPADRFGTGPDGRPVFRTGDIGRVDPDGGVQFVGRRDRQVAVDGHRLDLAEVEAAALRVGPVAQAVAGTAATAAGPVLALQVVPRPGATIDSRALRSHLLSLLPGHAVPTRIDVRRRLTTSANHKVVFQSTELRSPEAAAPAAPQAPVTDTQRWLVDSIAEILGRRIGLDEHFFEAGLTSMRLMQLHSLLAEATPVPPPATVFFAHPTVRQVAALLAGADETTGPVGAVRPTASPGGAGDRRRAIRTQLNQEREGGAGHAG